MELFEVTTENKQENFIWTPKRPKNYKGVIWPSGKPTSLTGDFGAMVFQQITTDKYGLWYNDYDIKTDRTFKARLDYRTVELNMLIRNNISYKLHPFRPLHALQAQFNLTHTPYMENTVKLKGQQQYITFDLHVSLAFLETLAEHHPKILVPFLEQVYKGKFVSLYPAPLFANWYMLMYVQKISDLLTSGSPNPFQLDGIVAAFLEEAITYGWDNKKKEWLRARRLENINKIQEAVTIILSDLPEIKTTEQLARKLAINDNALKKLFKELTGHSIYQFGLLNRLMMAFDKLQNSPTLTIEQIGLEIGYHSAQSFSKGFSKHFHNPPTRVRDQFKGETDLNIDD